MEPRVLLFTLILGAGAALFFGLIPTFQSTIVDVAPAIRGEEIDAKAGRILFRKGLVVFQMSLSLLLLIAAGLFLRSLHNLLTIDAGFARENILVASVESGPGLDARLLREVKNLPGVVSAALADSPPLGTHTGWNVYVPGYTPKGAEPRDSPSVGFVSPGYFTTMGIPLLLGRDIDDRDNLSARDVMVVNETFAKYFFGSENPIGRRVGTKEGLYQWEIIGVVKNSKYTALREGPIRMIYVPARPGPWASRTVVDLRTSGNVAAFAAARAAGRDGYRVVWRAGMLPLAAIGLYGLTSYGVARRAREFGIRIAIGARTGSIVGLVVNEALWLLAAGTAAGLAAAWVLGRVVEAMLFGIGPADPVSTVLAILTLVVVAVFAAWIPACRAARVDPMRALRWD